MMLQCCRWIILCRDLTTHVCDHRGARRRTHGTHVRPVNLDHNLIVIYSATKEAIDLVKLLKAKRSDDETYLKLYSWQKNLILKLNIRVRLLANEIVPMLLQRLHLIISRGTCTIHSWNIWLCSWRTECAMQCSWPSARWNAPSSKYRCIEVRRPIGYLQHIQHALYLHCWFW